MSFERITAPAARFLERHENAVKYTAAALAASTLTATAIVTFQATRRRQRSKQLKHELEAESTTDLTQSTLTAFGTVAHQVEPKKFDESLIEEQLARNIAFLGHEGATRVRRSFVVVVGVGDVGSWAALMLLRSGVQHIRLVDPGFLTIANMTFHAVAKQEDIGTPKVLALQKHGHEIAPFTKIDARVTYFNLLNADALLNGKPDFVVDAMGRFEDKINLIKYCHQHKIQVISCVSAGSKADPTRIQIADLSRTMEDPLARSLRRKLRKEGIDRDVAVAFSIEKPSHVVLLSQKGSPEPVVTGPVPDFRHRRLPVLGPIPAMFGMAIATRIILKLAEFSALQEPPARLRDTLYGRIYKEVGDREEKNYNSPMTLELKDIEYIFEEIWEGKSAISGPQDRLTLARWDRAKPHGFLNSVCMSRDEARAHDALPVDCDLAEHYGHDVVEYVAQQFDIEQRFQRLCGDAL